MCVSGASGKSTPSPPPEMLQLQVPCRVWIKATPGNSGPVIMRLAAAVLVKEESVRFSQDRTKTKKDAELSILTHDLFAVITGAYLQFEVYCYF